LYRSDNPVFFTDAAKKKAKPIPAMGHYNPNLEAIKAKTRFMNMGNKPEKVPAW
jgi:ribosomal protein S16